MSAFEIPATQLDLEALVRTIHSLSDKKEFGKSLALCQHLIANDTTKMAGYRERSTVWQDLSEHDLAIYDLQRLTSLGSQEPVDYYNLGIALLKRTEAEKAVAAFSKGIELSAEHDFSYYLQSCLFHRAAAYLRMGRPKEALKDCEAIEDGYSCYLPSVGMKTKEELVAQGERLL